MSQISSQFANLPGISAIVESYENKIQWGPAYNLMWFSAQIYSGAVDSTNSPTWRLRPGLVMGVITSTGQWTNYSATATDGSQVAQGVLAYGLRMQDVLTGSNVSKFYAMCVGGRVIGANLIGLDLQARQQMSPRFVFDDNLIGNHWFPFARQVSKSGDYTVVAADNFTVFDNVGAGAGVTFTLPTLANGYMFGFRAIADFSVTVASAEGDNIVAYNDASADSLAFSTGGQIIGGGLMLFSNPGATKWIAVNQSAGANTITVAT